MSFSVPSELIPRYVSTIEGNDAAELKLAWIYLLAAGLCEIGFTTALRYIDGFKRPEPVAIFIVCIACTLYFFEKFTPSPMRYGAG